MGQAFEARAFFPGRTNPKIKLIAVGGGRKELKDLAREIEENDWFPGATKVELEEFANGLSAPLGTVASAAGRARATAKLSRTPKITLVHAPEAAEPGEAGAETAELAGSPPSNESAGSEGARGQVASPPARRRPA